MAEAILKGGNAMKGKRLSISSKRQITIPQKFYTLLGFDNEAECILRGNELILRPVKNVSGGEFAEQILAELIDKGLQGEELFEAFKAEQKKIRPAVASMLSAAQNAANGSGEYSTYEDVFNTGD